MDLRPLHSAGFRHLAVASWVNEFGNFIGEIVLTLLVYAQTHSPLESAALFLSLRFLPALLAPVLTVRVEVLPTRVVLAALYAAEALLFAGLAFVAHHFSLPAVFALGALDGLLGVTASALTRSAVMTDLMGRHMLREGNAILSLGTMMSTAGSPVIAGLLVAWKGTSVPLIVDAATFLVTAAVVATAPGLRIDSNSEAGVGGRLRRGLSTLTDGGPVPKLMTTIALVMVVWSVPIPIEVVFVKHTLHAGSSGYGLLLGSWGVGMVLGGAGFALASRLGLMPLAAAGTMLNAAAYGGLALSPTLTAACICSVAGGIGNAIAWVAATTALQERIPANTRSAIMSVLSGLNQVMPAVGFLAGGVITAIASPRYAYGVAAVGMALAVIGAARLGVGKSGIFLRPVKPDGPEDRASNVQGTGPSGRTLMATPLTSG